MVWTPDENFFGPQTPQSSFETSAIRKLHKAWFPSLPFAKVEKECAGPVRWDWYKEHLSFPDQEVPELTFIRDDRLWSLNLHDLLHRKLEKLPFLKLWEEQPSDGLIFPLIGIPGIVRRVEIPPSHECFLKEDKDGRLVCIEKLSTYAESMHVEGFYDLITNSY